VTPAEAALRALEALPHATLVVDGADRLVLANAAFWREAGADPARFPPGTALADLLRLLAFRGLLGAGDPVVLAREALAEERGGERRRTLRSADGERLTEVTTLPLPGGGLLRCVVDVTSYLRAEAAARERVALLERVLASQHGGVALFDAASRLVLHNAAYRHHSGVTPEMLAGTPSLAEVLQILDRTGEFRSDRARNLLREALEADRRLPRSVQRERIDGSVIRYLSTPQPDGGFLVESEDITDLRRAEDEARRRAAILDGVLEALPQGVCVWGPDARVALFNTAYARLMAGAPLAVGDSLSEVIRRRAEAGEYGPGDPEEIYAREMGRDLSVPQERRRLRANGTALDVRTAPLPDGGHVSVVSDITALWRAEADAQRRAALLETAMASLRHGLIVFGPDRKVVAANALASELAGHAKGFVRPGLSLEDLVADLRGRGRLGPEPEAGAVAAEYLARDRSRPHRSTRRTADGRVLEVSSDPTPDGGFVVTQVDITALAEAEDSARQRAAVLRVMLENMRHGICLFDGEGRVVAANALAAKMSGLAPDAMRPGRHILELRQEQILAGEYGPEAPIETVLGDRMTDPLRAPDRYIRRRANGMIVEVTTDRTPDGGFVRTYTDVTEDRRIRDELERARAAAEAASEAKSRFLATMSHELRTPLAAVIGFAEALLAGVGPAEVAEYAGQVRDAGRQLLSLIDDILEVARAGGADEAAVAEVDPVAVLAAMAATSRAAAEAAGLSFEAETASALPRLRCDERRLRRILRALLDNAVKFTPPGGRVRLLAAPDEAGGVVISVADTGIGMAPEDIPRAFEPFTQLDASLGRRFAGSGLGLHLARLLAASIGASLTLESAPGEGTTATLRLPRGITISSGAAQQETT